MWRDTQAQTLLPEFIFTAFLLNYLLIFIIANQQFFFEII